VEKWSDQALGSLMSCEKIVACGLWRKLKSSVVAFSKTFGKVSEYPKVALNQNLTHLSSLSENPIQLCCRIAPHLFISDLVQEG
jgi:hypothetical protein